MTLNLNNRYLLLLFLVISYANAKFPTLKEIEANEEYQLKMDYQKKTCLFIDKNTDYETKNDCFHIVSKLYSLTKDKGYLYDIAEHYFKGYGVTQNLNKGLELMEILANSDHEHAIQAQATLGIYYTADYEENEPGYLIKDLAKGEYWTKKAADNGDPLSQYFYARILQNKGEFNDAIYWYKKAVFNGDLDAIYKLAELFREGFSVEISKKQLYKFLHEAAEQDYAPAFQELYFLYASDNECEKAKFWYNKFINSDVFKKIQQGVDPDLAITEIFTEKNKKKYIEEVNEEMAEIEKQSKQQNDGE